MRKQKASRRVQIQMEAPYPSEWERQINHSRGVVYTGPHDNPKTLRRLLIGDPVAERLQRRSLAILDVWSVVLPSRVVKEDLGDYFEDIASRAAQGQRVLVWICVAIGVVRTGLNAVGCVLKQFGRTRAT